MYLHLHLRTSTSLPQEDRETPLEETEDDCYADRAGPSIYDMRTRPSLMILTLSSLRVAAEMHCVQG